MENKDFDPQNEFDEALAELNAQKEQGLKSKNPFKSIFSKSKTEKQELSQTVDLADDSADLADNSADFEFDPNNSEFDQHSDQFELNRSHLDHHNNLNQDDSHIDADAALDYSSEPSDDSDSAMNNSPRAQKINKNALTTNILKVIAVALIIAILALLAYFFFQPGETPHVPEAPTVEAPVTETPDTTVDESDPDTSDTATAQNVTASTETSPDEDNTATDANSAKTDDITTATAAELATPKTEDTSPASDTSSNDANISAEKDTATKSVSNTETSTNDSEASKILSADIPEDEILVKEEIDTLVDQSTRLSKQEELLVQRVDMMDELTDKKAEQIALLEKQLAEFEAQDSDK